MNRHIVTLEFSFPHRGLSKGIVRTLALLLLLLNAGGASGQNADRGTFRLEGTVKDTSGAVIPGATVEMKYGSSSSTQVSNAEGVFAFESLPQKGTVLVRAQGFEPLEQPWQAQGTVSKIELVLRPAAIAEQMTVTATRTPTRVVDSPATVVVLSSQELLSAGAVTLDDTLRQVPGFSLFRRSGSRTANPTSQGVSLRGLGASGASRALVISDDKPLNDPFGGWVYWDRIPHADIESAEVIAGGASPLYGSVALGGVVNVLRHPVDRPALTLYSFYGN